jgi:hypothetical protein
MGDQAGKTQDTDRCSAGIIPALCDEKNLASTDNDQQQQTITNKTPYFRLANRGNNLARQSIKQILVMQF